MFIWPVLEWCLVAFIAYLVFSQMVFPALMDRPPFPLFRRSYKEKERLAAELRELDVKKETKILRKEVAELKEEVEGPPKKSRKARTKE